MGRNKDKDKGWEREEGALDHIYMAAERVHRDGGDACAQASVIQGESGLSRVATRAVGSWGFRGDGAEAIQQRSWGFDAVDGDRPSKLSRQPQLGLKQPNLFLPGRLALAWVGET